MKNEELINKIKTIKQTQPGNLMARHFNVEHFLSLDEDSRQRLAKIIASGVENPDSQMGAYAMNPDDYDAFATMLDPMIRDSHGIPADSKIAQEHDWDMAGTACDLGAIDERLKEVSMRVRVARNVATFPLPGAMSKEQRVAFEDVAAQAFAQLIEAPAFGGQYLSITPGSTNEIDADEYQRRVKAHQMFKDMSSDPYLKVAGISADWPCGRGMYVSRDGDFLVWVEKKTTCASWRCSAVEISMPCLSAFARGSKHLRALLPPFATSPRYGNVTSCPTNLGAGMRASLHMKLPRLTSNGGDLTGLKAEAKKLGLAVRGAGGEHSGAGEDGLVDISPSARLGVTEMQIMRRLYGGAAALWAMEQGSP